MKLLTIKIILSVLVIGALIFLIKERRSLQNQVSDKTINIKSLEEGVVAYKDRQGTLHTTIIEQRNTLAELKQSKDSNNIKLLRDMRLLKAKLKDVDKVSYVNTKIEYVSDTVLVELKLDTTINLSKLPHVINTVTIKDSGISSYIEFVNEQTLIWLTTKETIKPKKKFLPLRWFQKKQNVTRVDIKNSNPYIKTTDQKFIIITK